MVHVTAQWVTQVHTAISLARQAQLVRTAPNIVTVQYMEPVISSLGNASEYLINLYSTLGMTAAVEMVSFA